MFCLLSVVFRPFYGVTPICGTRCANEPISHAGRRQSCGGG